jgi:hypothetical protein
MQQTVFPRHVPWGTPERTGAGLDDPPSTTTDWLLPLKKLSIHATVVSHVCKQTNKYEKTAFLQFLVLSQTCKYYTFKNKSQIDNSVKEYNGFASRLFGCATF